MKKIILLAVVALSLSQVVVADLCPDGSYVGGSRSTLCPDGSYVGGSNCRLMPDGSYVGE